MAFSLIERIGLSLAFTLCCQFLSAVYLWLRLLFLKKGARTMNAKTFFSSISPIRFLIGVVSSSVLFFAAIHNLSLNPPNITFVILLGIAAAIDAWIERYPLELAIATTLAGWIASSTAVSLTLRVISTAVAFGLGFMVFGLMRGLTGRNVIAWGDVMFAGALSSQYGFVFGLATLGSAMVLAGISAVFLRRMDPKIKTIPLIPFMALAFSAGIFFHNSFSF